MLDGSLKNQTRGEMNGGIEQDSQPAKYHLLVQSIVCNIGGSCDYASFTFIRIYFWILKYPSCRQNHCLNLYCNFFSAVVTLALCPCTLFIESRCLDEWEFVQISSETSSFIKCIFTCQKAFFKCLKCHVLRVGTGCFFISRLVFYLCKLCMHIQKGKIN